MIIPNPEVLNFLECKEYYLLSKILHFYSIERVWPDAKQCAAITNQTLPMMYRVRKSLLDQGILKAYWVIGEDGLPIRVYKVNDDFTMSIQIKSQKD